MRRRFYCSFSGRKIEIDVADEIIITGDKLLLQLAINNLLDNAIKYSGKDDVVLLKVFQKDKKIRLQVIDEGYGVSEEKRKRFLKNIFAVLKCKQREPVWALSYKRNSETTSWRHQYDK